MNFETVKNRIEEWLAPELNKRNLFLVDVKFPAGKHIEVFIDSDTGVQIAECAVISRLLEKKLDESGLVPENYVLDVSSPGMSNPLKLPRQYKRRIGQILEVVKTDGTQIEGALMEANEETIKLREVLPELSKTQKAKAKHKTTAEEWTLNFSEIKKAMLQLKF